MQVFQAVVESFLSYTVCDPPRGGVEARGRCGDVDRLLQAMRPYRLEKLHVVCPRTAGGLPLSCRSTLEWWFVNGLNEIPTHEALSLERSEAKFHPSLDFVPTTSSGSGGRIPDRPCLELLLGWSVPYAEPREWGGPRGATKRRDQSRNGLAGCGMAPRSGSRCGVCHDEFRSR